MDPAPRALSDTVFQSLPPRVRPPAGSRGSSSLPHRGASLTLPSNNRPLPPLFQGSREPTVPSVTHQAERARCRVIVAERTTSERATSQQRVACPGAAGLGEPCVLSAEQSGLGRLVNAGCGPVGFSQGKESGRFSARSLEVLLLGLWCATVAL